MDTMRLLYIEDSCVLRETVARGLRKAGFAVDVAGDGDKGLDLALSEVYDLVILDLMIPLRSGLEVLAELRAAGVATEVLILTAKVSVDDRVEGLESGADDYLVKPFAFQELLARVRALLRRRYAAANNRIQVGSLRIDTRAGRALVHGVEVPLRRREFNLLEYLARRCGEVVSSGEIFDHVYDGASEVTSNSIQSSVSILRRRLRDAGAPDLIRTVPRRGYLLEEADVSATP